MEFKLIFNYTALIAAAYFGHSEIVDRLLSEPDIEINSKDILIQNIHNIQIYHF